MKTRIILDVDTDALRGLESSHLAALWHATQACNAPQFDAEAEHLVRSIGAEIVRRWLADAPALLYERQPGMSYWHTLQQHGAWTGPGRTWQPHGKPSSTGSREPQAAAVEGAT